MKTAVKPVSANTFVEISAFLHREARLLDEHRYRDWLGLLTDDVHYCMPTAENRYRRDGPREAPRMSLFDDHRVDLERRVARFELDTAWPEDPPTRHFHLISNVEAYEADDGFQVFSAFVNYRSRGDHDEMLLVGRREDLLRTVDGELKLARRHIHMGQSVLTARNLNTFL